MHELIVCEKPAAAKKVAEALADSKPTKEINQGVAYYRLTHEGKDIVVGAAVGHLFGLAEKNKTKGFAYPIFDIEWVASFLTSKSADYTKKYVDCLKKLAKNASSVTVACDYDTEGEVIGLNVVRFLCNRNDARRMKFSTLTTTELQDAYKNTSAHINWGQAHAGETRHYLDYYYGINISRALTRALKAAGLFQILSTGRVQGPALKLIADREKEIRAFKPVPYWELNLLGTARKENIEAWHATSKFWEKTSAETSLENARKGPAVVTDIQKQETRQLPPFPFDLTSLQTESYRVFGFSPKVTADLAQDLYTAGYTSYPRTSSQQLPPALGIPAIVKAIAKQAAYKELASSLLSAKTLAPHNGPKTDPAHPAIYPTGNIPKALNERQAKVYDLIVKRFLSTMGTPATRESVTVTITTNKEPFLLKGSRTTIKGWHVLYAPYVRLEEAELPPLQIGDSVTVQSINMFDRQTQPPKRFTPASIIKELEKRGLGTKATRADIVETLYDRDYVRNESLTVTDLGMHIIDVLQKYCPKIIEEELTRHFETDLDGIRENKQKPADVLAEARTVITEILSGFSTKEKEIGQGLLDVVKEQREITSTVGPCRVCNQGTLTIRRGRFGLFIACNRYPECKTTFNLPNAKTVVSKELCPTCTYPMITVIKKGKKPQLLCINLDCPTKHTNDHLFKEQKCEKCETGTIILRRSIYGSFASCNKFPACRNMKRLTPPKDEIAARENTQQLSKPTAIPTSAKPPVKKSTKPSSARKTKKKTT